MPKINKTETTMRIQALPPEKSKVLLVYLTSFCAGDELFFKGAYNGLKSLERSNEAAGEIKPQ